MNINTSTPRAQLQVEEIEPFPLIRRLPPYLFAAIEAKKRQLTFGNVEGRKTLIDFGLGKPDLPADEAIVRELLAGVERSGAHGYAPSHGIPELREAICDWYRERYEVELDPESEAIVTIGSKEGLSHLALAITQPGDVVFVPDPAYPIHESAFVIAGAAVQRVPLLPIENYAFELERVIKRSSGKGRVIVLNFPSNPTGICVSQDFFERIVYLAKKHDLWVIHDLAYADIVFEQEKAPSILAVKGASDIAVEFFTMSKTYNMSGWRVGYMCGNRRLVDALKHAKSYFDYGTFRPIQEAAVAALKQGNDAVRHVRQTYLRRCNALVGGLNSIGWKVDRPEGGMFVWARIPQGRTKSIDFSGALMSEAGVVVSPGIGFGPAGDDYVRFSLVQNEAAIGRALEAIALALS